jgi:hypothetical protein
MPKSHLGGGKYMENSRILYDDWTTRYDGAVAYRKKAHCLSLMCTGFLLVVSMIGVFIDLGMIVMLVISLIMLTFVTLEWLKIKNNHLIIRENQIEITNKYNKTTVYQINMNDIFLEINHSFNRRSGGIIMKFYDSKANFICKYEDMLNGASPFGVKQTRWEKSVAALDIRIDDPEGIIKNR